LADLIFGDHGFLIGLAMPIRVIKVRQCLALRNNRRQYQINPARRKINTMKSFSRLAMLWLVLGLALCCISCGDDDDDDSGGNASDDDADDSNDDAADDEMDDDTTDADDDTDDDDSAPFPNLDPTLCLVDTPVDLQGFDQDYPLVESGSWVLAKNFYLLSIFSGVPEVVNVLQDTQAISAISEQRDTLFREAAVYCVEDIECWADALLWSDSDAQDTGAVLSDAFTGPPDVFDLAGLHLRPSGMFHLHIASPDAQLLQSAWSDTVDGLHQVFDSYARSLPPAELDAIASDILAAYPDPMLFFEPLIEVVLAAMDYYGRDEAGRYEPMQEGENQKAFESIPLIDWDAYRFSTIIVPGLGPETEIPLHPGGRFRCNLAARRFNAGLAPLIVFSGGHVHPDQTRYSEAIEMKKYLMQSHGIPEEAILVDPHARHTTTNLRDVSRLIFRYGIPPDKPALITTDPFQNFYIDFLLTGRCLDELGYLPWRKVTRLALYDSCLMPAPTSLYADPRDPLDP
jgi:DUF218 domain